MTTGTNSGSCCGTGSCGCGDTITVQDSDVTTVHKASGTTCGHCEGAVSKEVSALEGVTAVQAVDEAGHELVGRVRVVCRTSGPGSTDSLPCRDLSLR